MLNSQIDCWIGPIWVLKNTEIQLMTDVRVNAHLEVLHAVVDGRSYYIYITPRY
jgi:hypothetical protein